MDSPVAKIKERLSIEEVVSSYIKLDQAGANLRAKCPFHNEKTPSFFVSPTRGSYYCFGCSASGDIFTFVEEFEGLDFKGALKFLADKAQVPLGYYDKEKDQKASSEKERLYEAMEESAKYFSQNLEGNTSVLKYLKDRGLTEDSIKDFQIGFAMPEWRRLYDYLKSKNFTDTEIERAGLAKKPAGREGGAEKGMYDRFRGRIIFPINDSSGRVIAFSGRLFVDDPSTPSIGPGQAENQPKYLNSPDTPIFSKHLVLYGLDKAKVSIRKNNFSILVEGQMDLVLSHQSGYRNTIATSGTALSDSTVSKENVVSNLGLIRRLSPNIVLAFDGDEAGLKASNRAGLIAMSLGMDVKVALMPSGVDPADLILKSGSDAWRQVVKDAKHIIEFLLAKALKDNEGDTRKLGKVVRDVILPFIGMVESSIETMHFLKKISDSTGIPESALGEDLKRIEKETRYERKEIEEVEESLNKTNRKDYILRRLLGIVLWQKALTSPDVGRPTSGRPTSGEKSDIDIDKTMKDISLVIQRTETEILQEAKKDEGDLIFEAEVFYGHGADLKKDIEEMIENLKEEYLREELGRKMHELREAEEAKDPQKSAQILAECQIINNKIQDIKNNKNSRPSPVVGQPGV